MEFARGFADALIASKPSPALGARARDLDWLVGCWSAVVRDHADDGSVTESRGEWWFAWVLDGRALQDVWIVPTRRKRQTTDAYTRYGTSLRFLNLEGTAWNVTWINPVTGKQNLLAGSRSGDRIVLTGLDEGTPIRWSFNDITPTSFLWRGEHQSTDGLWHMGSEFALVRGEE